ncbi:MAG: hypothetical protein Kow0054_27510 [Deferrisoma sp.]
MGIPQSVEQRFQEVGIQQLLERHGVGVEPADRPPQGLEVPGQALAGLRGFLVRADP